MHAPNHHWSLLSLVLATTMATAACTPGRDIERLGYVHGLDPTLQASEAKINSTNQETLLVQLAYDAGITRKGEDQLPAVGSRDWGKIANAGFNLVDVQCTRYIDALFWWNRYRRTTVTQLSLLGASTAAVLGIAQASASAIAITAAAFGLSTATVENIGNSVLYELDPSGVQMLVQRALETYKGSVALNKIDNRPAAVAVVQGYLAQCLPASIETRVNEAVNNTAFVTVQNGSLVPQLRPVSLTQQAGLTAQQVAEPLAADAPAIPPIRNPIDTTPALARVFAGQGWTDNQLRRLQAAFCIPQVEQGIIGPRTVANVNLVITGSELNPAADKARIDENKYRAIDRASGGTCDTERHKNFYENTEFRDVAREKDYLADMQSLFPGEAAPPPSSFAATGARELIGRARTKCGFPNETSSPFANQMTPDLVQRLDNEGCGAQ